jgi:hypothetical protein
MSVGTPMKLTKEFKEFFQKQLVNTSKVSNKEIARRLAQSRAVVGKKNEGKITNRLGIQVHN